MAARIENISFVNFEGRREIVVSFDNDRHHAMMIFPPHSAEQVAQALINLARNLNNDPNLA
jgi:hypothetical protein